MTELTVFLIPFVIGSMAGAVATLFMTGARRQVHDNEAIALGLIADIAEDSTTGENLPHIARIARIALDGEIGAAPRGGRRRPGRILPFLLRAGSD